MSPLSELKIYRVTGAARLFVWMRSELGGGIGGGLGQRICRTLRLRAALTGSVTEALPRLCLGFGGWLGDGESLGDGFSGTLDLAAALTGAVAETLDRL